MSLLSITIIILFLLFVISAKTILDEAVIVKLKKAFFNERTVTLTELTFKIVKPSGY